MYVMQRTLWITQGVVINGLRFLQIHPQRIFVTAGEPRLPSFRSSRLKFEYGKDMHDV